MEPVFFRGQDHNHRFAIIPAPFMAYAQDQDPEQRVQSIADYMGFLVLMLELGFIKQ